MIAIITKVLGLAGDYWKPLAIAAALALAVIIVKGYMHSEYLRGVADTKAANAELITKSRELTDDEKNSAHSIATDAARSVCTQAGVDVRECDGL